MSFTAIVKDDLSRVQQSCDQCALSELSALIRVCGTLSYRGPGQYSIRIATETGTVARAVIQHAHKLLGLNTQLTPRRSVLHRARNYLIEIPDQDGLEAALIKLGILSKKHRLATGIEKRLIESDCCAAAYLRGAFMAGGFVADPRGDFHLEIAVAGEQLAQELIELCSRFGATARLNRRRGAFAVYLKSYKDVERVLASMGARRLVAVSKEVRQIKLVKNRVNRLVNAEMANQARSSGAAAQQLALIRELESHINLKELPDALREFCNLRQSYPDVSLRDLGELADPPLSKSALWHRYLRLQALLKSYKLDQ